MENKNDLNIVFCKFNRYYVVYNYSNIKFKEFINMKWGNKIIMDYIFEFFLKMYNFVNMEISWKGLFVI